MNSYSVRQFNNMSSSGSAVILPKVAGVVLLRDDYAALLQLRDNQPGLRAAGKWVFPGGHCHAEERTEVCARRELQEETAYVCSEMRPLTSFIDNSEPGFRSHHLTFFWSRFDGRQSLRCCEGQALKFVERSGAPSLSAPAYLVKVWDLAIKEFSGQFRNASRIHE